MAHSPAVKQRFFDRLNEGWGVAAAARDVKIHIDTGYDWIGKREAGAFAYLEKRAEDALPNPKLRSELSEDAARALDDFEYFRYRYLGRRSKPWQIEAGIRTVEWLNSDDTELMVVNCPPGAGKSTLFTCDIPLWRICNDRTIRVFLGHRVRGEAEKYARRIKRALERTRPLPADPSQGRMEPAEGCLAQDYGRFKPRTGDVWRVDEFTVLAEFADEETSIEDKEATVTAKGMGTEFLGMRADLVIWDDLVTSSLLRSQDQIENQQAWWDNEGVTRVEPGGCLILVGQRMGANDLYRYCLDERLPPDDDDIDSDAIDDMTPEQYDEWLMRTGKSRYEHIIYPAHFDDRCTGKHGKTDEYAYPNGCLLDPYRIPWKGKNSITTIRANRASKYRVQYQQEDVDPDDVLVPRIWIDGGRGPDGIEYPGCLDRHRAIGEIPHGLTHTAFSVMTVDPSPTQFWSVQWWLVDRASQQRYLIDHHRARMESPDWLGFNVNDKLFYGLAEDWVQRARTLGFPISHVIFEQNAAQRFVLQQDYIKTWQRIHRVLILPHNTTIRKLDETYGVQMLRDIYRYGNVRLPYRGGTSNDRWSSPSKVASDFLIREVTMYPQPGPDYDCMMAQWFLETNLDTLTRETRGLPKLKRPGFLRAS